MRSMLGCATAVALFAIVPTAALTEPPPPAKGPVDALVSSPGNFKLLLDNDHVRVLQYTLPPGARDHWHTHPPRVGYVLSGAKIRVTEADGSHQDYDEKTGETYWGEFSPLHDTLNLDTKPYIVLLIEVKDANPTSASADEPARQIALAMANQMLAQRPAAN
jgi:quercetin dioxygenase-like cupin family protein